MPSLVASGGMLIGISTPYRRMGLLHAKYRDHFGVAGDDVLVVQGDSATFHLALSAALIEAHKASDPEAAVSEALVEKLMAEINRIANKPCSLAEREQWIAEAEAEIDRLQRTEEAIVVATGAPRERGSPPWGRAGSEASRGAGHPSGMSKRFCSTNPAHYGSRAPPPITSTPKNLAMQLQRI
jgi:hypothetical protein